jgi:uncharacterized protein YndB with AHSA1/START domain
MIGASLLLFATVSGSPVEAAELVDISGARSQQFTLEVAATPAELWHAFTTAEGWKMWAVPAAWVRSSSPLVIETSYDPKAQPDGPQNITQQFDRLEPQRRLSFRTTKAPAGFIGFDTYSKVVSDVTFEPVAPDRTRVRFVTGPFPDTADGRRLYSFFLEGNRSTLEHFAEVYNRKQL